MPDLFGTLETSGIGRTPDEEIIDAAYNRAGVHDPARLNAVAYAVTDVLGFVTLTRRYAVAVLALEALEELANGADHA